MANAVRCKSRLCDWILNLIKSFVIFFNLLIDVWFKYFWNRYNVCLFVCLFFSPFDKKLLGLISLSSLGFVSPGFFFQTHRMNTIKRQETWKQLEKCLTSQTAGKKEMENDHLFTSGRSSSGFKWVQQCLHSTSVLWKRINASCVKIVFSRESPSV